MIKFLDQSLQFLSENTWGSIFIFFFLFIVLCPLVSLLFENYLIKWNISKTNSNSIQLIVIGSFFLFATMVVYVFSKKIIFAWILFPLALIIGGFLGLVPFSFINQNSRKRNKHSNNPSVTIEEIPLILKSLQKTGTDAGSFILFLFPDKFVKTGFTPGLQYSIEKDQLGIDYLLNSEFNRQEEGNFIKNVLEMGYKYERRKMNGVEYIRIEGDSLVKNGQELLRRMYRVKDNQKIQVVLKGFSYIEGDSPQNGDRVRKVKK